MKNQKLYSYDVQRVNKLTDHNRFYIVIEDPITRRNKEICICPIAACQFKTAFKDSIHMSVRDFESLIVR